MTENEINKFTNTIELFGKIFVAGVIFSDRLIINNNMYINYLINWIKSKQIFKTILLYRKSRDGDHYETSHKLCVQKGTTLVLIKSNENFLKRGLNELKKQTKIIRRENTAKIRKRRISTTLVIFYNRICI